jgi:hypothetical protein
MIRVVGQRFELNDPYVSVIGELELERDREPRDSVRREIEKSQKKGAPLSVILEESSNLLGKFSTSKKLEEVGEAEEAQGAEGAEEVEQAQEAEGPIVASESESESESEEEEGKVEKKEPEEKEKTPEEE